MKKVNLLIMFRIILLAFLIFNFQSVFSQVDTITTTNHTTMKKSPILGLRTAGYMVGDLDKAQAWYTAVFETEPYFVEPFYVGFNIGGYELGLLPEATPVTDKKDSVLTYWGVNDIQKSYDHFIEYGAMEHEKPTNVGGDLMVASVKDPWGNIIGLIYNPAFKLNP